MQRIRNNQDHGQKIENELSTNRYCCDTAIEGWDQTTSMYAIIKSVGVL